MPNISLLLEMAVDVAPDRLAVGLTGEAHTNAQLLALADEGARRLIVAGAESLVFADRNGAAAVVAMMAAARAGIPYVPINYRLPEDAQRRLESRINAGAKIAGGTGEEWIASLRMSDPAARNIQLPDETDSPAVLLFTSGTSAEPKIAALDHGNLMAYIFGSADFLSADSEEAVVQVVPPFHIAGVAGTLSALYAGRRVVPRPIFDPGDWVQVVRAERITHAFLVPTMMARILDHLADVDITDLPSLRSIAYGGARMPLSVVRRALEAFPNADFVNAYGLTETSSTVALLGPEDHRRALTSDDPTVSARLASVGRPLPGIEVEVVDNVGKPLRAREVGRIRLRGAQISGRYLGTTSSIDDAGWLMTGDEGSIDDDGYLYVHGRADDTIIVGGENVSPTEVEDCLISHPGVSLAAVVGIPDDEWGEIVGAAVVRRNQSITAEEIAAWSRERLGGLKSPKSIRIVSELPMTPTGKIIRREVRAMLINLG